MNFNSVQEIIDFAIAREKEAVSFYMTCGEKAERQEMKAAFQEMAEEEARHVTFLENVAVSALTEDALHTVNDPKMESYIVEKPFHPNMSYQELLQLAIHREAASYQLYNTILENTPDAAARKILQRLADEELKHKERLEEEYNTQVLREN